MVTLVIIGLSTLVADLSIAASFLALSDRDSDPVVLEGSELPGLLGLAPDHIVAFRYAGGWIQIPVQVDERCLVDFGIVYGLLPVGVMTLAYCDPETYTGTDPDPGFDSNDELVFMAKDCGDVAPAGISPPANVNADSRRDVAISDPLTFQSASVYLFESDGTISPDAGFDYVAYDFALLSGPYLTTYDTQQGPNPENSVVSTAYYRMHFSDRWIRDEINVYAEGSTGVDILDRHKNLFGPGNCSRSEDTFSNGEGAFFANIDGPVRAIRSYLGANSGPLTQRDHFFYERRHDVRTTLRVHTITGVMDFYDYSPDASGMSYYNDLNIDGALVDGMPMEVVTPGALVWEMITGLQGTLIYGHVVDVDIPGFNYTSYYLDDMDTFVIQCTGDDWAYGSSGIWIDQPIPNTDPLLGPHYNLSTTRTTYMEGPDQNVTLAQQRYEQVVFPLTAAVLEPSSVGSTPENATVVLHQNYPNPFNPTTTIRFDLPAAEAVNLAVYAVDGARIITLRNEIMSAGRHAVSWNGNDALSEPQSSGMYFYRLEAGDFMVMKKMMLVR